MTHRWIIAAALTLTVVALSTGIALADNGPHGGFTATTDACAGCHRVHTGVGDSLLKMTSTYALCTSCHNGTGANTKVTDGLWVGSGGGRLKGGGFTNASMNTNLTGVVTTTVTSKHGVVGITGYTSDTVWGSGAISASAYAGSSVALQCSSCHDPHGKAGVSQAATYRILRATPSDVTELGGAALTVPDVSTKVYTISDATGKYYGQQYPSASDADPDNGKISTISTWCARCHTRIHATSSGASGDAIYKYRHKTNGSNVSNSDANGAPACFTCHVVHGTVASMGTNSSSVPKPGTAEGGGAYLDSSLLRINNRGVCQTCHNK